MKLVFAGTPQFAASSLEAILAAGHDVMLVLTQPDRPSGRGLREKPSAVKALALREGIDVFQPQNLKDPQVFARIAAAAPEAMIVAAYGLILPQSVLDIAPQGALNIHASLLPRWRGAAPVQRAILAGDEETGVCIMQMNAGLDTGPVLMRQSVPISAEDTAGSLLETLTTLGAQLIVETLRSLDDLSPADQPAEGVTYAAKIEKREARIDWNEASCVLTRKVRAFNPFPGAAASLNGMDLKIWRAVACDGAGKPGEVIRFEPGEIRVACGEGALRLIELQRAGGRRLPAAEFNLGVPVRVGDRCEMQATDSITP